MKQQKFEELVAILQLVYPIEQIRSDMVNVQVEESFCVMLQLEDGMIAIHLPEDDIRVLAIEESTSVKSLVLSVEKILLEGKDRYPTALSTYLYYRLLGMIWGYRADPSIRDADLVSGEYCFVLLHALKGQESVDFEYTVRTTGEIYLVRHDTTIKTLVVRPEDYVRDPEGTIETFFSYFNDIDRIYAAGRK